MMIQIDGKGNICISKNETAKIHVEVTEGELLAGDAVVFAVKANQNDQEELMHIDVPSITGGQTEFDIEIASSDFEDLPFGVYKYDILLKRGDIRQYITWMRDFIVKGRVANAE